MNKDAQGRWKVGMSNIKLKMRVDTLQRAGEPFPIARNARSASIASDGTLVYLDVSGSTRQRLAWLNRQGEKIGEIGQVQESIFLPRLAPDGRRVTVTATENSNHGYRDGELEPRRLGLGYRQSG